MADSYLSQQSERLNGNRKLLNDALRTFKRSVSGRIPDGEHNPDEQDGASGIHVKPLQLPDKPVGLKELLSIMARQISKSDLFYLLIAALGMTLMGMLIPYVTKQFYDEMIPSNDRSLLFPLAVLLISATIGSTLFGMTRILLLLRMRDKMSSALQASLMDRVLRLPANFFRKYPAGKLGAYILKLGSVMNSLTYKLLGASLTVVLSVLYFFQITQYARPLLKISILSVIIQLCLLVIYTYLSGKWFLKLQTADAELSGTMYGILKGITKIKNSAAEERMYSRWARLYSDTIDDNAGKNKFLVLYSAFTGLVIFGTTVLTYKYALLSQLQLSDYAAYLSSYGMVTAAVAAISSLAPDISSLKPALKLCEPILKTVPEEQADSEKISFLSGGIDISGLTFRYNELSPYIFNNLDIHINPGEYVGIVGPSGSGKSTLVRLLLGLEKPESGSIFYGQYSMDRIDPHSLRQKISTVLQDGRIFQGTIYDNIVITNPTASLDEVREALRKSCLEDDINDIPMGLHTVIGEGGNGLSGGQCQRLLIARALVAHPDIIIMDEATSALDNITQGKVIDNLDSLNCTRICIAHRVSTVRHCSRILVLDQGRITEEGTFDSLLEKKGQFYELVKNQM